MINDKDGGGTINEDEIMEVLYHRYGKEAMTRMTEEVFKHDRDGDKELDFQDFLKIVNAGMNNQVRDLLLVHDLIAAAAW
mmetsp:Transcript_43191/g.136582  ORF Transcript_43191/g.136582 Transcript_43191/m.136582 type:complete len:80 (-) Transcript_43191:208-447(-)